MRKVLLVDTNVSSAPLYDYLVDCGFEVFVVGSNPMDYLARVADKYIELDYSKVSLLKERIEQMDIEFIVPGCNDLSYQVCATLNAEGSYYGLESPETTDILNRKDRFRTFAAQIGLPVPRVIHSERMAEMFPVIVKPVDAYSGRGMTIVRKPEQHELRAAIEHAKEFSRSRTCIIEEYVEGQLYSHSAFITAGNIVADFIVEEHGAANPLVVDTSRVIYDFPLGVLSRIRDSIALMAEKLNLVDGLIHTQFIQRGESFWLIEVTRRCPGDLYSQLIELSTGFRYANTYAQPFVKQEGTDSIKAMKKAWIMRHTMSQPAEGTFLAIRFITPVEIEKIIPLSVAGDMIKASPFGRIALVFLRCDSDGELSELLQKTLNGGLYKIEEAS